MPLISLSRLLRYNLYYWLAMFSLSLLSNLLNMVLYDKEQPWAYLPMMLGSDAAAMLLTALLVIWSYHRIKAQHFSRSQLLIAATAVAVVYIPLQNAFSMWLWDEKIMDLRFLIGNLDSAALSFFVWTACFLTVLLHQQRLARLAETSRLSKKIQQLELQALSHQLNPHFTFNALNSVCALLEAERYDDAETMSEQLSTFLRYSLSKSPDSLVQLADELQAIQAYLLLQKTRFGDKLKVNWQIDESLKRQRIPALLLQPLVENAIKYAVASRKSGATITIGGERLHNHVHLSVTDDGPGSQAEKHNCVSAGVGLNNIRNRLLQHFGDQASLHVGASPQGFSVDINLPLQTATS